MYSTDNAGESMLIYNLRKQKNLNFLKTIISYMLTGHFAVKSQIVLRFMLKPVTSQLWHDKEVKKPLSCQSEFLSKPDTIRTTIGLFVDFLSIPAS